MSSEANMDAEQRPRPRRSKCFRLQNCCFKGSLKTGCTIISIWSMTEALLLMAGTALILHTIHNVPICVDTNDTSITNNNNDNINNDINNNNNIINNSSSGTLTTRERVNHLTKPCHNALDQQRKPTMTAAVVVALLIVSVYFLASALLLYGIKTSRPELMSPWLWWSIGEMFMTFKTFTVLERSLAIVLKIYWCIVVYSYIEELKERREPPEDVVSYAHLRNRSQAANCVYNVTTSAAAPHHHSNTGVLPTHLIFPTHMTPEEVAAKVDAASAARLYGQQPPPYSPPQPGFQSSVTAAGGAEEPAAAAASGDSYISVLPPPTYEEATSAEAVVYLPSLTPVAGAADSSSSSVTTDAAGVAADSQKEEQLPPSGDVYVAMPPPDVPTTSCPQHPNSNIGWIA